MLTMTIASYAISVSYLGRETRRSKWLIEKRKKKLQKELGELQKSVDIVGVMKQKINEYTEEEKMLSRHLFLLSLKGAILVPSACFFAVIFFSGWSINSQLQDSYLYPTLGFVVLLLGGGFFYFLLTLNTIEWAASRIPLPAFEVAFESELSKETFRCKEQKEVEFRIRNIGELMAEDLSILVFFPPEFHLKGKYNVIKQDKGCDYPDYNAVVFEEDKIHVDSINPYGIMDVVMPEKTGIYVVPIRIHERNIGVSEHKLTFEIVA